jgi:cell division GTPase FtsZ
MNMISARIAIIGVGEDGLEARRRLISDESVGGYLTDLGTGKRKPSKIDLVFVLGAMDPENNPQALSNSALSILSRETLNIAVIGTVLNREDSRQFNPDIFLQGIESLVDACFVVPMAPKLFNADGGRARVNVLSNAVRIILETMTWTDNVRIDFDDLSATLAEAGRFWLSTGIGSGDGRAMKAARSVLIDSFSDNRLVGAQSILLRVVGGDDLLLSEVHDVLDVVRSDVTTDTDIIFGVARNHTSQPSINVTLMATHFSTELFPMFTKGTGI